MKKKMGQVMTPKEIVCMVMDSLKCTETDYLCKTFMEPSFGTGNFLMELVKRIAEAGRSLSRDSLSGLINRHVFGFEKDKSLYDKAVSRLASLAESYHLKIPFDNLRCADTLEQYDSFIGKFDYVVGNPPYIRFRDIGEDENTAKFELFCWLANIYVIFYEMGLKMLNSTGKLAFITPNSFLKNVSQKEFRRKTFPMLSSIHDFGTKAVFDASVYTCICTFDRNEHDGFSFCRDGMEEAFYSFDGIDSSAPWIFYSKEDMEFLATNKAKPRKIKDICTIKNGVVTNLDKVYIFRIFRDMYCTIPIRPDEHREVVYLDVGVPVESSILHRCAKEGKFHGTYGNLRILFPYREDGDGFTPMTEKELMEYPLAYRYLCSKKNELSKRTMKGISSWFLFGRTQGLKTLNQDKLIMNHYVHDKISVYRLPKDVIVYSGLFLTGNHLDVVEKLLLSNDFLRYARLVGKEKAGGYYELSTKMIGNFGFSDEDIV